MENFTVGQKVIYEGKQTHIETIHDDGTCNIANPYWSWDEEAYCLEQGEDYIVPYWVTVKLSKLKPTT